MCSGKHSVYLSDHHVILLSVSEWVSKNHTGASGIAYNKSALQYCILLLSDVISVWDGVAAFIRKNMENMRVNILFCVHGSIK